MQLSKLLPELHVLWVSKLPNSVEYTSSQHYREDPTEEVEAALAANGRESVSNTLDARLQTEESRQPRDEDAIRRILAQRAYLDQLDK